MWEYNVEVTEFISEKQLLKKMNSLGKEGWEIIQILTIDQDYKDQNRDGSFNNSYKLYMKKLIS